MARKRRQNPNRFQKQDDKSLFSFDPLRRTALMWGLVAGVVGGLCMLRPEFFWQIVGVFLVVGVSNYHISRASRHMPRLHVTIWTFAGVMVAMFSVIMVGTIILAFMRAGKATP